MRTLVITVLAALCLVPAALFGQHDLAIAPYATSLVYLDDAIRGDTTAGGQRVDPERVYVLERDGLYFAQSAIQNTGFALRVRAAYGSGALPVINAFRGSGGGYAAQIFQADTLLWLRNLSMNGWDEGGEDFSIYQSRIINVNRIGTSVYVDSCTLNGSTATLIQTSVAAQYLRVTNSTFANAGNVRANNLGNGRAIDFRNVSIDSAFIENNSFFNMSDRVFRHFGAGQVPIRNLHINHNTIYNELAEHGCIGIGRVEGVVRIVNNLFVDNFIFGNDSTASNRLGEFGDTGERDASGNYRMTFVGTIPASDTTAEATYVIRNNYYSISPSLQTFYDSRMDSLDADVGKLIPLTWYINSKLGGDSTSAFFKVATPIAFGAAPPTAVAMAEWFFKPLADGGSGKFKQNATFLPEYDWERVSTSYLTDTLDLTYSTSSAAYTGADGGQPAGDLRWWNMTPTGVEPEGGSRVPLEYSLSQNYPNPFNPATTITYSVPKSGVVTLKVFNVIGQEVATLVNAAVTAGSHQVSFDASTLPTGLYVYTLRSGDFFTSRRMVLIK